MTRPSSSAIALVAALACGGAAVRAQNLAFSPAALNVSPGGTGTFTLRLVTLPPQNGLGEYTAQLFLNCPPALAELVEAEAARPDLRPAKTPLSGSSGTVAGGPAASCDGAGCPQAPLDLLRITVRGKAAGSCSLTASGTGKGRATTPFGSSVSFSFPPVSAGIAVQGAPPPPPAPPPNLRLSVRRVEQPPYKIGQNVNLKIGVLNAGPGSASWPAGPPAAVRITELVSNLVQTVTFPPPPALPPGVEFPAGAALRLGQDYQCFLLEVDPQNVVREARENDNRWYECFLAAP